jgi:hypothetical protein
MLVGVDGPAVYIAQNLEPPKNSLFSKARRQLSGWQSNGRVALEGWGVFTCVELTFDVVGEVEGIVALLVGGDMADITVELNEEVAMAELELRMTVAEPEVLGAGVGSGTRSGLVIGSGSPVVAVFTEAV